MIIRSSLPNIRTDKGPPALEFTQKFIPFKDHTCINRFITKRQDPSECADVSFQKDGVYNINPKGARSSRPAYCVMRNGIKWTPISIFALGNEAIHLISTNGKHKLHIDLELRNGSRFYADYSLFKLNNESSQYLLKVTGYSGTAGDAMDNYDRSLGANGAQFSTRDRDNGEYIRNCAELYHGGWWYVSCSNSDLNGNNTIYTKGSLQFWNKNDLKYAGIKQSEMMITKY
ncbi:unnamed protein product [Mytilus edulis]|uniref:Fibrinogen C-terminal domain-containing protein n=1 Tax=Mytilus edulis TaxID=6550 RepID=A0A8S3SGI6_MYTED|nr:unnamed protein product [Mytilus edulis]